MKHSNGVILLFASIVLCIAILEVFFNTFNITEHILWHNMASVYGGAIYGKNNVVRTSENAERVYELIPNSSAVGINLANPLEPRYRDIEVHINSLGFRDPERHVKKPEGVYRIIILGGSNTFGVTVSDNDTYPRQLEKLLNQEYPGRFEVWNAGVAAYVTSQKVEYAKEIVAKYDPDILIFQIYNRGRRNFLYEDFNSTRLMKKNPDLYCENIPLPSNSSLLKDIHFTLVKHSSLYKFVAASLENKFFWPHYNIATGNLQGYVQNYSDEISNRMLHEFMQNHSNVLFFYGISHDNCTNSQENTFRICNTSLSPEYYVIHPPSYVYSYEAKILADKILNDIYPNKN